MGFWNPKGEGVAPAAVLRQQDAGATPIFFATCRFQAGSLVNDEKALKNIQKRMNKEKRAFLAYSIWQKIFYFDLIKASILNIHVSLVIPLRVDNFII